MSNPHILAAVTRLWAGEASRGKSLLDLSCGGGQTSQLLARQGFTVTATNYTVPPPMPHGIPRQGC